MGFVRFTVLLRGGATGRITSRPKERSTLAIGSYVRRMVTKSGLAHRLGNNVKLRNDCLDRQRSLHPYSSATSTRPTMPMTCHGQCGGRRPDQPTEDTQRSRVCSCSHNTTHTPHQLTRFVPAPRRRTSNSLDDSYTKWAPAQITGVAFLQDEAPISVQVGSSLPHLSHVTSLSKTSASAQLGSMSPLVPP